jgi:protein-S-isoprenylcysteine O-methyltransferase Ste14
MSSLELKIPPPVVALLVALAMWGIASLTPSVEVPLIFRVTAALVLFGAGILVRLAAQLAFLRARTTVNPLNPSRSSSIVRGGAYRFSRNPMYLGRLLQLSGWAAFLANAFALLPLPLFVWYITRFQILPEERALSEQFDSEYAAYRQVVRRWL